jgi:prevent-host-death family protein
MPIGDARADLAEIVNRVNYSGQRLRIALTRRGKQVCAIVSMEDLELLERTRPSYIDVSWTGSVAADAQEEASRPVEPMRIAAEHRPDKPPQRPGFRS